MIRRFFPFTIAQAGGLPYTPPLDLYGTGVWAAWSPTRKLSSSYTGDAFRAVRVGVGTVIEVPFDSNGYVDTAYIDSLGFQIRATIVYDQSGNGRDLTLNTGGLANDGSTFLHFTLNGKFCLSSYNFSYTLSGSELLNNGLKSYFSVTAKEGSTNNFAKSIGTRNGNATRGWLFRILSGTQLFGVIGSTNITASVSITNDVQYISGFTHDASQVARIYFNGTLQNSGSTSGGTNHNTLTKTDATGFAFEYFQEEIIWESDQTSNASGIQTNQNSYYGTY